MASVSSTSVVHHLLLISTCYFLLPLSLDAQETNNNSVATYAYATSDLRLEEAAVVGDRLIDLTCNTLAKSINGCTGRMSYNHPVPFYDDATLVSFSTSFTFKILQVNTNQTPGDGMAFFLSGYPSRLPEYSGGGHFGLYNTTDPAAHGLGQFVAVEFDTYKNSWDPNGNHIGIDINTVQSSEHTTSLPNNLTLYMNGTMTATVTFNNITRMLVASLRFHDHPSIQPVVISRELQDPKSLLPREVAVGFSASTGVYIELHQILAWSFNSTIIAAPTPSKGHASRKPRIIIVGGALLSLVLLLLVAWSIISCWKWTNRRHRGFEKLGRKHDPTRFEYHDLDAATNHFSKDRILGQGSFGVVYRGYSVKLGGEVAVKMLNKNKSHMLPLNNMDFYAELNAITSVRHKNLVKLVGWCKGHRWNFVEFMCWCWKKEEDELFLVYELVPKGSLHDHLHREETLPWETRYKIVKDIACALHYLHRECDPFILHRDIKPSNILLGDNFNAKLADFGLSRIADPGCSKVMTYAVGSEGYIDPLCRKGGKVEFSRSSDVYSFGVLLLEIACKQGIPRERVSQLYINRSHLLAADDKLKGEFSRNEMENVIILGLWCSYPDDSKKRPSMEQVIAVLEHAKPLPDLNSLLDSASVSTLEETYMDLQAPSSAGSSYEKQA